MAEEYKNNDKVSIDQIDCTNAKTVCEKAEVRGYPTLKAYLNGEQHAVFKGMIHFWHACGTCLSSGKLSTISVLEDRLPACQMFKWTMTAGGRSIETLREYINAAVRELTLETVS